MIWRIVRFFFGGVLCIGGISDNIISATLIGVAIMITPATIQLLKTKKLKPPGMKCPNCGADCVLISSRMEGVTASSDSVYERSFVLPNHRAKVRGQAGTQIRRQRIARCQKCGFDYPYFTEQEIKSAQANSNVKFFIAVVVCAVFIMLGFAAKGGESQSDAAENKAEINSVWAAEHTPLDDFKYYIDGDEITLTDYNGRDKRINIAPVYELEGKEYCVVSLDGTFSLGSVTSVIVPEGVTSIADNTFNSTGIKFLYLPSTLEKFNGWGYFHDTQKLYYGGTEEQWSAIYTRDRSSIDVVQIICAANVSDLIS